MRRVQHIELSSLLRFAMAIALLLPGACREAGYGGSDSAVAQADAQAVQTSLNNVVATRQLASSTLETKQADPGDRFVVLDVTARNTGAQPQVFAEGKLVNVDESRERSFSTPVSMLADEFLTLQVLKPGDTVRGRIAYEVPDALPGVLYWVPGNGNQRILLHVPTAMARLTTTPETSAHVSTSADASQIELQEAPLPSRATPSTRPATPARAAAPRLAASAPRLAAAAPGTMRPTPALSPPASTNQRIASTSAPPATSRRNEQASTLACHALVSRNDPAEKTRYLAFFSRECAGYPMPSSWLAPGDAAPRDVATIETPDMPSPTVSTATVPAPVGEAPRWPPRPGPAFDCSQAYTRAEHLVCEDAVLSLMDWELNRAYAQASRVVDDPAGLQRDEDAWRHRVRDACDTAHCVEAVYDQRTAQLKALAERQR